MDLALWIVLYGILLLIVIEIVYGTVKLFYYLCKLHVLLRFFKRLKKSGVGITRHRPLKKTCFGEKGQADYTLEVNGKRYEISILTFPSTRGRWNFEKSADGYFIECRRRRILFYKKRNHSGIPEHALDYRNETRLSKKPLTLPEASDGCEQILLLYPWPHEVTHTDAAYTLLSPGDKVAGRVLMDKEMLSREVG